MRWIFFGGLACMGLGALAACGGGDSGGGGSGGSGGGSGGSGGSGASGGGGAAGFTGGACVPTAAECYVDGPTGPGAECLAKSDNTGATSWAGRITQIDVKKPAQLATQFVQTVIIDKGISLAQPTCFENGEGTFTWMFVFDSATNKMRTGGALPVTDPSAGACFAKITTTSLPIGSIEVDVTIDADKLGFTASGIDVNVPIFLSPTETANPIILPLHEVVLTGKFNDDSHNCIGRFNGPELDPINNCEPDIKAQPPQRSWTNGGTLKGYIGIDEADQVFIDDLGSTLCVLLAGQSWKGPDKDCKSSTAWVGGQRPEGDWCAATNSPADASCKDAWLLEGDFAAAAFKVTGDCP